ncbi:DUF4918 family protein [Ilyomonas limi]|uniref:DUF4918 family protein n=2 Tax=Ilyomonas limi TaxID=2575867 RepID=A0A4U3KZE8_9BACT|nr:DUF4918 family protein [Ilyomonas limi]
MQGMSFAQRMKDFNRNLHLTAALPPNVGVLNPFGENKLALSCADAFYDKYYSDNKKRWPILGINPGRFGAGLTGVPFTDFKRLQQVCGIETGGASSHEPSSEFIYCMIAAMGGVDVFYKHFYINSICPLGFIILKSNGKWMNYNYYDDKALYAAVKAFIIQSIQQQIALGLYTEECFCLGKKNTAYLSVLNEEFHFFKTITELPHPRFIVQYKRKEMNAFIDVYVEKLSKRM